MKKPQIEECWSEDGEDFNHLCLGDLLDNMKAFATDAELCGMTVYKAEAHVADPTDMFCVDYFLETLSEQAYDNFGEHADDWPDCTPEAKKRLEKYIKNWLKKECGCNFWHVKNVQTHTITREDLE